MKKHSSKKSKTIQGNTSESKDTLPPLKPIIWVYELKQYAAAFVFSLVLFGLLSLYYGFHLGSYDLYIANKVMAATAAWALGIVLLMGPLHRSFSFFSFYLQYRKEVGIFAFFLAIAHGVVSLFFLPDHFPLSRFFGSVNWPFIFALVASVLLTFLFVISFQRVCRRIDPVLWWKMQTWGLRLTLIFSGLHFIVMKFPYWSRWYIEGGNPARFARPEWPSMGVLMALFFSYLILVRFSELLGVKTMRVTIVGGGALLLATYVFSFWWGMQF